MPAPEPTPSVPVGALRLPLEVLRSIFQMADDPTLAAGLRLNGQSHELLAPSLYSEVTVTTVNIDALVSDTGSSATADAARSAFTSKRDLLRNTKTLLVRPPHPWCCDRSKSQALTDFLPSLTTIRYTVDEPQTTWKHPLLDLLEPEQHAGHCFLRRALTTSDSRVRFIYDTCLAPGSQRGADCFFNGSPNISAPLTIIVPPHWANVHQITSILSVCNLDREDPVCILFAESRRLRSRRHVPIPLLQYRILDRILRRGWANGAAMVYYLGDSPLVSGGDTHRMGDTIAQTQEKREVFEVEQEEADSTKKPRLRIRSKADYVAEGLRGEVDDYSIAQWAEHVRVEGEKIGA